MVHVRKGKIILITGLSGSGKTTLGLALQKLLKKKLKKPVEFIDGDIVREFLGSDYGFSEEERFKVTKQIAFGAYLLANNGVDVIVANIAGKKKVREYLRKRWKNYIKIFLDANIKDCMENDPKGIYKKALKLKKPQLVGVDIHYEKPKRADIILYPYEQTKTECMDILNKYFKEVYRHG